MSHRFRILLDVKVSMRDGVCLSTDVYLPPGGERFPVLLIRTIYNNADGRYLAWMVPFVAAGYAVVLQDCRGRHDSDGDWEPYVFEAPDGFDTHEWIGRQPWCDGTIGTFGVSYPGFTQTAPATLRSPFLKALVPIASQQDNWGHHRVDGVIAWSVSLFFATLIGRTMQSEPVALLDQETLFRHLPLVEAVEANIGRSDYFRGIIEHEGYGEWWGSYSLRDRYSEVETPAYFMTGWYDSLLHETLTVFTGWKQHARSSEARRLTRLLVGPWSHQVAPWGRAGLGPGGEFADVAFGPDAVGDTIGEHLRWYDARLRGLESGIDAEPPVRLFVMGRNTWRDEQEWPLARTNWTDVYLGSGGAANRAAGDGRLTFDPTWRLDRTADRPDATADQPDTISGPPDRFTYDPADPVPSWGAQYQSSDRGGPRDRREVEARSDVLVYTSDILAADVEVTGPVTMELWASSSALDTDWTAALVDVFPDGRAIILCEGICRARFRVSTEAPVFLEPGRPERFRIDMWDTSNVFLAGHQIRLEVSSSNFPRYDRNLNTGGRIGFETTWQVALQAVFHDFEHPSRLILPIIPPATGT